MEFSDTEEEIIDLNKIDDKKEKLLSKKMKWVKSSLESISQMARSEAEETEYGEHNNLAQNEENQENNIGNEENQENLSDYNNNEKNDNNENKENKDNNNNKKKEDTKADSNRSKNIQNYKFIWDEGGNIVKLIGTFSNWKQQYDMKKDEKDHIFKISLPLSNEKYQYKFIVDGVWKCSQKQETIDDGKGNINNVLDLTKIKPKEEKEKKKKKIIKKNSKLENKKKIKEKKKKDQKKSDLNLKNEKKQAIKIFEYGNEYPDPLKLTEPNHSENMGKSFNINNMSKQKKIGNPKYYKFEQTNSNSSIKSYLNLTSYRNTLLNHIILLKKLKKSFNKKIGITYRYREKATTFIYYNSLSKKNI